MSNATEKQMSANANDRSLQYRYQAQIIKLSRILKSSEKNVSSICSQIAKINGNINECETRYRETSALVSAAEANIVTLTDQSRKTKRKLTELYASLIGRSTKTREGHTPSLRSLTISQIWRMYTFNAIVLSKDSDALQRHCSLITESRLPHESTWIPLCPFAIMGVCKRSRCPYRHATERAAIGNSLVAPSALPIIEAGPSSLNQKAGTGKDRGAHNTERIGINIDMNSRDSPRDIVLQTIYHFLSSYVSVAPVCRSYNIEEVIHSSMYNLFGPGHFSESARSSILSNFIFLVKSAFDRFTTIRADGFLWSLYLVALSMFVDLSDQKPTGDTSIGSMLQRLFVKFPFHVSIQASISGFQCSRFMRPFAGSTLQITHFYRVLHYGGDTVLVNLLCDCLKSTRLFPTTVTSDSGDSFVASVELPRDILLASLLLYVFSGSLQMWRLYFMRDFANYLFIYSYPDATLDSGEKLSRQCSRFLLFMRKAGQGFTNNLEALLCTAMREVCAIDIEFTAGAVRGVLKRQGSIREARANSCMQAVCWCALRYFVLKRLNCNSSGVRKQGVRTAARVLQDETSTGKGEAISNAIGAIAAVCPPHVCTGVYTSALGPALELLRPLSIVYRQGINLLAYLYTTTSGFDGGNEAAVTAIAVATADDTAGATQFWSLNIEEVREAATLTQSGHSQLLFAWVATGRSAACFTPDNLTRFREFFMSLASLMVDRRGDEDNGLSFRRIGPVIFSHFVIAFAVEMTAWLRRQEGDSVYSSSITMMSNTKKQREDVACKILRLVLDVLHMSVLLHTPKSEVYSPQFLALTSPLVQHDALLRVLELMASANMITFNVIAPTLPLILGQFPAPHIIIDWVMHWFYDVEFTSSSSNATSNSAFSFLPKRSSRKFSALLSDCLRQDKSLIYRMRYLPARLLYDICECLVIAEDAEMYATSLSFFPSNQELMRCHVAQSNVCVVFFRTLAESLVPRTDKEIGATEPKDSVIPIQLVEVDTDVLEIDQRCFVKLSIACTPTTRDVLRSLDLSGCFKGAKGDSIVSLHSLAAAASSSVVDVSLAHNDLEIVPRSLLSLSSLTRLDISWNKLDFLPAMEFPSLRYLNASHNLLKRFPACIIKFHELVELYLSHNFLEYVPQELSHLKKLSSLDISENIIKSVPYGFQTLSFFKC